MNTQLRKKNHLCNKWEQYYRITELKSYPGRIQIPTGTRCNINCLFCTERKGEKAKEYHYKDLSFCDFKSLIHNYGWHEALSCTKVLDLYGWGEPLINPDYEKIFDFIKKSFPGLGITISTNGIMFTRKWSEKIIPIENSEVNFSVNAATKETYLNLTESHQFERVINNILALTTLREKQKTKNPYISLSYVANTHNIEELHQFVDLAADLKADTVLVQDIMIFNKETEKLSLSNEPDIAYKFFSIAKKQARKRKININLVSFEPYQDNYIPSILSSVEDTNSCCQKNTAKDIVPLKIEMPPSPYFNETDCFDPWERLMINAEGEVFPCCRFQNIPGESLGNVYEQSFQKIWNNNAYKTLRKTINTDNPPPVCAICPIKSSHLATNGAYK